MGVVLITGSSRGIGAATARRAAADGHAIGVHCARDLAAAEAVADEIRETGGRAHALQGDVAREADVLRVFDECVEALGPLSGLVNSAGIVAAQRPLVQMEAERIERVLAVNVLGTLLCAREAVRRLSTQRGGTGGVIVNVSSAASRIGSPGEYVDYAASKGAVDTLTLGLAQEVAAEGIRVNAVRPGLIDTGIHARGGEPGRVARLAETIPLGRGGRPEEVAAAIVWLLSDAASYTTGALLDVAGGR